MSITAVQEFLAGVSEDESLQTELAEALQAENDRQAVADLAKAKGYEFSTDELWAEVQARQAEVQARQEAGELSDEELEAVAGGEVAIMMGVAYVGSLVGSAIGSYKAVKAIKW